ncbi:MAG: glycosyltransferase [Armatimonadetes bacterium]|nr:glycosyltransferase [Armatimonadota bacterium]
MRLLIVSQWFLCPPVNGARKRVYHLLSGLALRHEINFVSFTQGPDDVKHAGEIESICREVRLVPGRQFKPTIGNAVRALFSTRPRSSIDCWSEEMAATVRQQLRDNEFDAVIAFTTRAGEYLMSCEVPKVLDDDNADCAYFARLVNLGQTHFSKFRRKLSWVKVARHERRLIDGFDATAAVSEEDRIELASLVPEADSRGALYVVPNGVDLGLIDYPPVGVDPTTIISTGAMTYQANFDAALFFSEEVLPKIRERIPDVRFLVTGDNSGVETSRLTAAGATLTGFVEDIRPLVAGSAALVVPLRIGGGTRLKILEAMALGTPVVSTTLGAAGLGLRHGETALIADDPERFAECTVRLMQDRNLRSEIAAKGRSYVAENFGWEKSVLALEGILQQVVSQPRKPL